MTLVTTFVETRAFVTPCLRKRSSANIVCPRRGASSCVSRRSSRQYAFESHCSLDGNFSATDGKSRATRRAMLAFGASTGVASWGWSSLAVENSAILKSLQLREANNTLEKQELAGRNRLLGAKQQLAQVERLALAGSYKDARLQLRRGPMANVRTDVRAAEQEFGGLRKETGDKLVVAIEALDQGLRREVPYSELKELIAAVADADDRVQSELIVPEQ